MTVKWNENEMATAMNGKSSTLMAPKLRNAFLKLMSQILDSSAKVKPFIFLPRKSRVFLPLYITFGLRAVLSIISPNSSLHNS